VNPSRKEADVQITLGSISSIPLGEGRAFRVGARQIAVFRSRQGQIYATRAECPHKGGPLADGLIGGSTLICPLHSLKFDLETGKSTNGECTLEVYPARLNGTGHIVVDLPTV
jgi:nitrite reductase (NADH) small subunit